MKKIQQIEKQITCDVMGCPYPAVILKYNTNFCVTHQYEY